MSSMFGNCNQLIELNVSSFNTSNVKSHSGVFSNCNKLANKDSLLTFNK